MPLLSVWLHLLAAAAWGGGLLFIGLVLAPLLADPALGEEGRQALRCAVLRFRRVAWIGFAVLVVTGLYQLDVRASASGPSALWQGRFDRLMSLKLTVVIAIFVLGGLHDFVVGPRAAAARLATPGSPRARSLGAWAGWLARVNVVLTLLVFALAVALVRG